MKSLRSVVEWAAGIVRMPAFVSDQETPRQPEAIVWMSADESVLGLTLVERDSADAQLRDSLLDTCANPLKGKPHKPTRIRVASSSMAAALRAAFLDIEIIEAPTPEVDAMLASMSEWMGEHFDKEPSYTDFDVAPEAVASFFEAAAALYRSSPWRIVPDDSTLVAVTIEALDLEQAVLIIIGQEDVSYGLILFPDLAHYESYVEHASAFDPNEISEIPSHLVLNYERGADLAPSLRKEIAAQSWEVAGKDAYPLPLAIEDGVIARNAGPREIAVLEAVARALSWILTDEQALDDAWAGGPVVTRSVRVKSYPGEVDVVLTTPYGEFFDGLDGSNAAIDVLVEQFAGSAQAARLQDPEACRIVLEIAAARFATDITALNAKQLRIIVFDCIPHDVCVDSTEARPIVEATRALIRYLQHDHDMQHAGACLKVLGGSAIRNLETRLEDADNFSLVKCMLMEGRDAGFDVSTAEGIEAWLAYRRPQRSGGAVGKPGAKARKKRRKSARAARKRNR